jgi:hypothetical protein
VKQAVPLGSYAAKGAGLCAVGLLFGCIQILGYGDGNEFGPCASATDCPPGEVCGTAHRCEKPPVTTVSTCTSSCAPTDLCSNSSCTRGFVYGYSAGGTSAVTVHTAQVVECIQLRVPDCGVLTGVGIVTHLDVSDFFRFAVYDDESGRPTNRLAQTDDTKIMGGKADIPVKPAVRIGRCSSGESGYYWICFASSAEYVSVETTGASGLWVQGAAPDQIPGYLQSGLPSTGPTGLPESATTAALIYAWIAKPPK